MKVPSWFLVGCTVVLLNGLLLFSTVFMRHATAQPQASNKPQSQVDSLQDQEQLGASEKAPEGTPSLPLQTLSASSPVADEGLSPGSAAFPRPEIPAVPSLGEAPTSPSLLGPEDFMKVFQKDSQADVNDLSDSSALSQRYFEALTIRLNTVGHLTQSAQGLVHEANILFQRGQLREARDLIGKAAQLRELAAQLLVTRH